MGNCFGLESETAFRQRIATLLSAELGPASGLSAKEQPQPRDALAEHAVGGTSCSPVPSGGPLSRT